MTEALPFALLVFLVATLVAMPWRHPHPNHEFMLELLRLLEDEHTSPSAFVSGSPPVIDCGADVFDSVAEVKLKS